MVKVKESRDSFPVLIILTFLSGAAFAVFLTLGALTNVPNNGIFNNSIGNISRKYETEAVPADYAFSVWGLIYLFQFAWIIYGITTICRTNYHGPVMMNPVVLPASVHVWYILSCACGYAWYFMWDREMLGYAALALLGVTLCGYVAVTQHSKATLKYETQLNLESKSDLICIRVLVQNGLDLFYSWTTVATLLNLSMLLTYGPVQMSSSDSSTIVLSILGIMVVGWSVAENTVFFDLFSYVYTWYFILAWALTGIIVKNPDTSNRNTIISIVLLCVSVICLVAKIVVFYCSPPTKDKVKYTYYK